MICWKCHEPVQGPVCVGCGAIQPPSPDVDYFRLLGLDRRYHLAAADIDGAWREISRKVHTDRFAGRPAVERRMSLQWTAVVNEARRVLKDGRMRARYLATGRATLDENRRLELDQEFLEEIFDLQMGAEDDPEGVRVKASAMRDDLEGQLDGHFRSWEEGGESLDADRVEDLLSRLKYVDNALSLVGA